MPRWRNGIRASLRNWWEKSRGGSSPLLGTRWNNFFIASLDLYEALASGSIIKN